MIRTTQEIKEKFEYICKRERRSMSNQAEKMIVDLIENYESQNGSINIQKNVNIEDNHGTINIQSGAGEQKPPAADVTGTDEAYKYVYCPPYKEKAGNIPGT